MSYKEYEDSDDDEVVGTEDIAVILPLAAPRRDHSPIRGGMATGAATDAKSADPPRVSSPLRGNHKPKRTANVMGPQDIVAGGGSRNDRRSSRGLEATSSEPRVIVPPITTAGSSASLGLDALLAKVDRLREGQKEGLTRLSRIVQAQQDGQMRLEQAQREGQARTEELFQQVLLALAALGQQPQPK